MIAFTGAQITREAFAYLKLAKNVSTFGGVTMNMPIASLCAKDANILCNFFHRLPNMTNCRICAGPKTRHFFSIEKSPSSVEELLTAVELESDEIISLNVIICDDCGFIQLPHSPLRPDFYRTYDKSAAHSEKMRRYQEALAVEINSKFQLAKKTVLEVGCGDGFFSMKLAEFGADVVSVEPGRKAAEMARSRGITVLEDYFHSDLPLKAGSFEIIVFRQVLSHIENLEGFMVAADKFLMPGGLIIAEVPNVEMAISQKHYYDFFADYVNYFSPSTLNRLMSNHRLSLVESSSRMDSDYTLGVFCKSVSLNFMSDFAEFSCSLNDIIKNERSINRRVAAWGAGGRGVSLLVMCGFDQEDLSYVIDSSPDKQGLYTPGSNLKVVPPSILLTDPPDSIIITAILFQEEILTSLKEEFQFTGQVILLTPQPHIISI